MRLRQNLELLEERNASMMFFLPLDVPMNFGELRFTHCERAISFLLRKSRERSIEFSNPWKGVAELRIAKASK